MVLLLLKELEDSYKRLKTLNKQILEIKTQKEYLICLKEIDYLENKIKLIQKQSS